MTTKQDDSTLNVTAGSTEQPKFSPNVTRLIEILQGKASHANGVPTVSDDFYTGVLPEGHTAASVQALEDHNSDWFAATTYVAGKLALQTFKDKPDVDQFEISIPMTGKDVFEVNVQRKVEGIRPGSKPPVPMTTYGAITPKVVRHGDRANIGDTLKAKKAIQAEAAVMALAAAK